MALSSSQKRIYSTFIGVGLDFNTDLVEHITTNIRGANYLSVKNSKEFKKQMDEDFDYCVTSLVFNVTVNLIAKGFHIDKVFGSPESNNLKGDLMKVGTLFPSAKERDGQTKGGVILIKLNRDESVTNSQLILKMKFEDYEGSINNTEVELEIQKREPIYFQNSGIRKAILLTQYINLVKNFLADITINSSTGILAPPNTTTTRGTLKVTNEWKENFTIFKNYFESEMDSIGDNSLMKEVKVLEGMINSKEPESTEQDSKDEKN